MKQGFAIVKKVDGGFYIDPVDFDMYEAYGYVRSFINDYLEVYHLGNGYEVWVGENSRIEMEPPNTVITDEYGCIMEVLHGNIVILTSNEEGETLPLTEKQVDDFYDYYLQGRLALTKYGFYEAITVGDM